MEKPPLIKSSTHRLNAKIISLPNNHMLPELGKNGLLIPKIGTQGDSFYPCNGHGEGYDFVENALKELRENPSSLNITKIWQDGNGKENKLVLSSKDLKALDVYNKTGFGGKSPAFPEFMIRYLRINVVAPSIIIASDLTPFVTFTDYIRAGWSMLYIQTPFCFSETTNEFFELKPTQEEIEDNELMQDILLEEGFNIKSSVVGEGETTFQIKKVNLGEVSNQIWHKHGLDINNLVYF